jgi:hypothetical protein
VQVHEAARVALDLASVQEASSELHAVAYVCAASPPLPAGGRQLLARLVAGVASAVRNVPSATGSRHGVSDARTGDGVREGRLATACRHTTDTPYRYAAHQTAEPAGRAAVTALTADVGQVLGQLIII